VRRKLATLTASLEPVKCGRPGASSGTNPAFAASGKAVRVVAGASDRCRVARSSPRLSVRVHLVFTRAAV